MPLIRRTLTWTLRAICLLKVEARREWAALRWFLSAFLTGSGLSLAQSPQDTLPQRDPIWQSEEIFSPEYFGSAPEPISSQRLSPEDSDWDYPDPPPANPVSWFNPGYSRTAVGFGPAGLPHNSEPLAYHLFVGQYWGFPPWNAFKVWGEAISDLNGGNLYSFNIGGNLYTHRFHTSPYLGLGSGFGFAESAGKSAAGFNVGAAVGIALFRDWEWQMEVELEYKWLFRRLGRGFPSAAVARVGFLF